MVVVKAVSSKRDLRAFIKFPFQLYRQSAYWVPPLIREELYTFNKTRNPIYRESEAILFLAYKNGKVAGRVAAIINRLETSYPDKKKVRFGWLDMIDDISVTQALLEEVMAYGRSKGMVYLEGPCGFSNMDKAGMLVYGFEEVGNMTTYYNAPYYPVHLERLGFEKAMEWVGYRMGTPTRVPERVIAFAQAVLEKYGLRVLQFPSSKHILPYADGMFQLMNRSFAELPSFVPIQDYQVKEYKEKYLKFLHPDFLCFIADKEGVLVGFAVTMPSFAKALQKARGRLFPLGFLRLMQAQRNNDTANMNLIGVDPHYQSKGLTAIIFQKIIQEFTKRGIRYVETNPELEENKVVQALWKNYHPQLMKRWRVYRKAI